jgi:hypothetical protein
MNRQTTPTLSTPTFTTVEQQALYALRAHYRKDRDLFSAQERARLRFLRWLYRTSRLVP